MVDFQDKKVEAAPVTTNQKDALTTPSSFSNTPQADLADLRLALSKGEGQPTVIEGRTFTPSELSTNEGRKELMKLFHEHGDIGYGLKIISDYWFHSDSETKLVAGSGVLESTASIKLNPDGSVASSSIPKDSSFKSVDDVFLKLAAAGNWLRAEK